MPGGRDQRPWLILSRTEVLALKRAALASLEAPNKTRPMPPDLARAFRVIEMQLRYIDDDSLDGSEPSVVNALVREATA